jgi:hypothetical protein
MPHYFHQTNHGNFIGMDLKVALGSAHLFSAHAEEGNRLARRRRKLPQ